METFRHDNENQLIVTGHHHGGMGAMLAGGAAMAAAAAGAHHMSHHGHYGHHHGHGYGYGYHGHGKFKHGKFKHGKFGKHGMFGGKHKGKFFKKWKWLFSKRLIIFRDYTLSFCNNNKYWRLWGSYMVICEP